ncbi:MAG: archaetidylserine decarboxylase [Cyanobacteria bacterium J06600_6]
MSQQKTTVRYRDRQTGKIVTEKVFSENTLRWLYENWLGFKVLNYLLNNHLFCWLYGKSQDLPLSRRKIADFVRQYQIEPAESELLPESYASFNAFFARRLKPDARPFVQDPQIFCAPGDGKVLVYPQGQAQIDVKGTTFSVESLLNGELDAQTYRGGAVLILRLAPYDYHRFHFPVRGQANSTKCLNGQYHSVNPIALAKVPKIFCLNKRAITEFDSHNFGRIACIEIGAITIGSIVQTYKPGAVAKGQEKGYFQYGGSTVILLFEPNKISFDADLIRDSQANLEVRVMAGTRLGTKYE